MRYFEFVASSGILKEGTSLEDGVFCGADPAWFTGVLPAAGDRHPNAEKYVELITDAHASDWYNAFSNHPSEPPKVLK